MMPDRKSTAERLTGVKAVRLLALCFLLGNSQIFTEENTTLRVISDYMRQYHDAHGRYPKTWIELSLRPFCFNNNTMPLLPRADEALVFKPVGCKFTYVMKSNVKSGYRIERRRGAKLLDFIEAGTGTKNETR